MEAVRLDAVLRRCVGAHGLAQPKATVEEAVLAAAGIYGAAPTCYLSLAVRMEKFGIPSLDGALYERRSLVRIPAMRGSIYMLPPELVPHGLALAHPAGIFPMLRKAGLSEASYAGLASSIEGLLRSGPKTAAEIRSELTAWRERVPGTLNLVLRQMSHEGRIVRGRVRGGWRSQQFEYVPLREWVRLPAKTPTREQALRKLAPLYLAADGPATAADFAWWAGVPEVAAKEALERIEAERVFLDKVKGIHYAAKESLDEIGRGEKTESPLVLLPYWDAYVMAHAHRARYLDPRWEDRVVDRGGNVTNVILRDGRVAGVWDVIEGTLKFVPFDVLRAQAVKEAAAPYAEVLPVRDVVEVRSIGPLSSRGQDAFMNPLS